MMDGQVGAVRRRSTRPAIDTGILGYAPKYASGFYGPFREAVNSCLQGDRATYQQDASRTSPTRSPRWRSTSPRVRTS